MVWLFLVAGLALVGLYSSWRNGWRVDLWALLGLALMLLSSSAVVWVLLSAVGALRGEP